MGKCVYCGQPAGFLKSYHKPCRLRHDEAAKKIDDFFHKALSSSIEPSRFRLMTEEIARENFVKESDLRQLEIGGLRNMITSAFTGGNILEEQESRIGLHPVPQTPS